MAINFPDSPTDGQTYINSVTGQTWTYELATNSWTASTLAVTGGVIYKGSVNITAAPPTGAKAGEQWSVGTGGTANAGYGPDVTGTITKGSMVMYTGTGWLSTSNSVPDATETVKGIVELATAAETTTGTDTTRAVHPAGLKTTLNAALNLKLNLAGGNLTGGVTQTERTISASTFNLAAGNFFSCGAIAIPNPTNAVAGMSGLIRLTAAPTGWGGNFSTAPTVKVFPSIVPFYVESASKIRLGAAVGVA